MPSNRYKNQGYSDTFHNLSAEDQELFEELNEQYGDENEGELSPSSFRIGTLFFRLLVLLIIIVSTALALGNLLQVFTLPSLDFLIESRRLSQEPLIKELRQAVVQVLVTQEGKRYPFSRQQRGTGFNIEPGGLIVTNRHLLEDAGSVNVIFPGRGIFRAEGWASSDDADLGVIILDGEELPHVEVTMSSPDIGDEVTVIGNPLNFSGVAMRGDVMGYRQVQGYSAPVLEVGVGIHRGSSGSPVFDEDGRVVGVVFASVTGRETGDTRGLAVSALVLQDFLGGLKIRK